MCGRYGCDRGDPVVRLEFEGHVRGGLGRRVHGGRGIEAEQAGEGVVGERHEVGAGDTVPVEAGDHVAPGVLQLAAQVERRESAGVAGRDMQEQSRRHVLAVEHAGLEFDHDLLGLQGPVRGVIATAGEQEAQGHEDELAIEDPDRLGAGAGSCRILTLREGGVEASDEPVAVACDEAIKIGARYVRGQCVAPRGHEAREQLASRGLVDSGHGGPHADSIAAASSGRTVLEGLGGVMVSWPSAQFMASSAAALLMRRSASCICRTASPVRPSIRRLRAVS